jgi:hypothetical protein
MLKGIDINCWKGNFVVEFEGEEGIDEGGLLKEWYILLS